MKIGLISDTHSYIDTSILDYLSDCDEIWHAGDVGDSDILKKLEKITTVRGVFGNIDDHKMRLYFPENNYFEKEGLHFLITHIAGSPPKYNSRVKSFLDENKVDVLICGHSHILKVMRDATNNIIFINPGAAGIHGFHKMRTMITFEVSNKSLQNMKVIELGKRGKIG